MSSRTTRLDIRGMSCASCSRAVGEALEAFDGMTSASVNFATDEGSVEYDPKEVSFSEVYDTIEDAGYEAPSETRTIGITRMSCANYVDANQKSLESVPGVIDAEVNFATDEAYVTYNPAGANLDDMYRAVEDAGYTPARKDDDNDEGDAEDVRDATRNKETRRQERLTLFDVALSLPLFAMFVVELFGGGLPETTPDAGVPVGRVGFAFATPVQVYLGHEFYENPYTVLVQNRTANMDVLITMESSTTYLYSVAALVGLLAGSFYFGTATLILVFITLGNYLEVRSKGQASGVLQTFLELEAGTTTLVDDNGTKRKVPLSEVEVGNRMKVRLGRKIPTDGAVVGDDSAVDESIVTGESVPVSKADGDEVVDLTVNQDGVLVVESTRVDSETAIQQIVSLIKEAQDRQLEIQNLVDRISAYFVPAIITNTPLWGVIQFLFPEVLTGFIRSLPLWELVVGGPIATGGMILTFGFAAVVFASVVLIACPYVLGLATPVTTMVGMVIGAQNSVLFKGDDVLEYVKDVGTVVPDKTGMLTKGEMALTDVVAIGPAADGPGIITVDDETLDEDAVPRYAASAGRNSEHPLACVIVAGAADRGLDLVEPDDFGNIPGHGVRVAADERPVLVGSHKFLSDVGVDPAPAKNALRDLEGEGKTAMLVAVDGDFVGVITGADEIKESVAEAVAALRDRGAIVHMITDDDKRIARAVAEQVGTDPDNVGANVLPEDKVDTVEFPQAGGMRVIVVGDGINDAPTLVAAYVGMALGPGTDMAIEATNMMLMRDNPPDVVKAIRISVGTFARIK